MELIDSNSLTTGERRFAELDLLIAAGCGDEPPEPPAETPPQQPSRNWEPLRKRAGLGGATQEPITGRAWQREPQCIRLRAGSHCERCRRRLKEGEGHIPPGGNVYCAGCCWQCSLPGLAARLQRAPVSADTLRPRRRRVLPEDPELGWLLPGPDETYAAPRLPHWRTEARRSEMDDPKRVRAIREIERSKGHKRNRKTLQYADEDLRLLVRFRSY